MGSILRWTRLLLMVTPLVLVVACCRDGHANSPAIIPQPPTVRIPERCISRPPPKVSKELHPMTISLLPADKLIGLLFDRIDDLEQYVARWWHACGMDPLPEVGP
jgi:hypothetical protein